jgi:uncharacterized membrane protein YgcG
MTPEMFRTWMHKAKTEHFTSLVQSLVNGRFIAKLVVRNEIMFSDSAIMDLQSKICFTRAIHLRSKATALCGKLLLDWLMRPKYHHYFKDRSIFISVKDLLNINRRDNTNSKQMLLRVMNAWLGGHWKWLVVFCESTIYCRYLLYICFDTISDMIRTLPRLLKGVIIVNDSCIPIRDGFVSIKYEFSFDQLTRQSQELILKKKVDFQGCEVPVGSKLLEQDDSSSSSVGSSSSSGSSSGGSSGGGSGSDSSSSSSTNIQHILGPDLVSELTTPGTTVNIVGQLHPLNMASYKPNVLERKIWIVLTIAGCADGAAIITHEAHGGTNQKWYFDDNSTIRSSTGMVMDVEGCKLQKGTKIIGYEKHGGVNQKFRMEPC